MKNLNTILPFYDALTEQYKYRDDIRIPGKQIRLQVGIKRVIPFTIRRTHSAGTTAALTFLIKDASDDSTVQTVVAATYLSISVGVTYDYIEYDASLDFAADLPIGKTCYITIEDSTPTPNKIWYSERFIVVADLTDYMMLEFWNDEILNNLEANFHQKLYIDNTFKTPDYIREDVGEKMDGILLKQSQTVQKVLNLYNLITPEFLLDALITLPMMTNVQITNLLTECIVPLETRLKDPDWYSETGGSFAKFDIQFVEWVVIKKGGYKEVGCSCAEGVSVTTFNTGQDTLTAGVPANQNFTTEFADVNYSLNIRAFDAVGNDVSFHVSAKTVALFTIEALENCTIDWIAADE